MRELFAFVGDFFESVFVRVVCIVVASLVVLFAVIGHFAKGAGIPVTVNEVDLVRPAKIVSTLLQTGVIKPQVGAMIAIGARSTGTLEEVRVRVGDKVAAGQLVARIDSRAIQQGIKQAEDILNKTILELNRANSLYPVERSMQQNTINAALSNFDYLKGVYKREEELFKNGFSRQETLEKARHEMTTAETEYQSQRLKLGHLEASHTNNIKTLQTEISRLRAELDRQKIELTYTEIYSPINGVVSTVNSVEGETIVAGLEVAKLITVFRPELLEMFVYVDESDVGKVKTGMKVTYTVDTYQGKLFEGVISRINLQSELKDGVIYYVAIVDINKADALLLRPEMTTNVRVITSEKEIGKTVVGAAVRWEDGEQVVYKMASKNLALRTPIKTGIKGEERIEILSGLEEGDRIAIRPIFK